MSQSMFYITAENTEEAKSLSKRLVEEKLVACINVLPYMNSFFYWKGKAQSEEEVLMIGKTRTDLVEKLVERVKQLHSYEVPCVVSWEIKQGNPDFLNWINEETT